MAAAVLALSCVSQGIPVIPDGLTQAELIQRGQEASDKNNYPAAIHYYETLVDRYPSDIENTCAAEYEIAFIHYKQKNYDLSKTEFTDLLMRYNTPDEELLPAQFKILSQKILSNIASIEAERAKRNR